MPAPTNPNISNLDMTQIIQRVFDEAQDRLRIDGTFTGSISSTVDINIDAATGDNVCLSNSGGTLKNTLTTVGSKNGIDSNIINDINSLTLGHTTIKISRLLVTDVPQKITSTPLSGRNRLLVRVLDANAVYFGSSSGISSTVASYPKLMNEELALDFKGTNDIYVVCASGLTSNISILEMS